MPGERLQAVFLVPVMIGGATAIIIIIVCHKKKVPSFIKLEDRMMPCVKGCLELTGAIKKEKDESSRM